MKQLTAISWIVGTGMLMSGCKHSKPIEVRPGDPSQYRSRQGDAQAEGDLSADGGHAFENVMNNPLQDEQWMLKPTGSGNDYQWVAVKKPSSESTSGQKAGGGSNGMMVQGITLPDGQRTGPVYVKTIKQLVAEATNTRDPMVRMDAIAALSKAQFGGEAEYMSLYRAALDHDPDIGVRVAAVRAIGQHGSAKDLVVVESLTRNANSIIRAAAMRAADQIRSRNRQ
ncbi:MAG TPA: HEAT repeat domain-containing protein [Phycisphaerales bacterium]|nr:HEAT repeat domain-containing protein [Phycisphaerales bacterium]